MTVSTTSAAVHITPVVLKTFFKHYRAKGKKFNDGGREVSATDDVFFDEAFHIVQAFIRLGTLNTVESLQAYTNTHVPAPYWAACSPVLIPLSSCNKAADLLIDWFGPEEIKAVVGGERWWQVRGLDGVDAEWVTEKEYLKEDAVVDKKLSATDANILKMDHLETVMLYVHGGAYFWGSINTHRYQIIKFARKMKGRVFAVNYRKAPQYPWPCPLQDVIASYLYLIEPPPGALHRPVPPSKIVLAGDSAGAGLALTLLTVLRDMGIEQPAGAVLISPWVDLTHSFPSVMKNMTTDIIPPHGFIHKPSPIWPLQPLPQEAPARIVPTQTSPPPDPGHADTLRPGRERLDDQLNERAKASAEEGRSVHARDLTDEKVGSQRDMLKDTEGPPGNSQAGCRATPDGNSSDSSAQDELLQDDPDYDKQIAYWEPKPPKVLMNSSEDTPLELRGQIQLYATNEQLTHPLVSPILQGSLGNLCPLYIIAGDGEVLRDEIIYLAHKAANPKDYPTRRGVVLEGRRQRENVKKFQTPTKVHLQVFDGMCHVLTVFTFTPSAKYAYRSIAEFAKHVTGNPPEHLERNPFPELHIPPAEISDPAIGEEDRLPMKPKGTHSLSTLFKKHDRPHTTLEGSDGHRPDVNLYKENEEKAKQEVKDGSEQESPKSGGTKTLHESDESRSSERSSSSKSNSGVSGEDVPGVVMIRERVDIYGKVRPMEPREELEALHMPSRQIGIIKEEPVRRWMTGQELWDKKFKRQGVRAQHRKEHYHKKFSTIVERARERGLELHSDAKRPSASRTFSLASQGEISQDRRWGPLDLEDERPPPSAIAGRRDNRESLALIRKNLYYTAPVTHRTVPKRSVRDVFRAAFDTEDNFDKAPDQSVAEEQKPNILPVHGMRIWQGILDIFIRKSSEGAVQGKKKAASAARSASRSARSED